jgi:hypothetical protein
VIDPLLIPILGIIFGVGVPGVALATHFVLRPLVRDIVGAIQSNKPSAAASDVEERLLRLEDAYYRLDERVAGLIEAEQFRRELESGRG